jgi:hypothetical protein
MSGGPDFSVENFNTDDVEVLIGGQARPGARGGLRAQKQSQGLATATFIGRPASRLAPASYTDAGAQRYGCDLGILWSG